MEWRWAAATHDGATGLPNAAIFRDRLTQALEQDRRRALGVCVMVAAVPGADERELANTGLRVTGALRASDTVARFGGSDLALLLPGLREAADAEAVVERLELASGGRLAQVGFAVSPQDAVDPESLLLVATRRRDDRVPHVAV